MNEELLIPGVPTLSDEWIAQRTQHLTQEVASPSARQKRRFVLTGASAGAVAVAASLVGLLGPWSTPAFAGWSAQPTTPSSGQLSAAETACASLATNLADAPGSTAPSALPPVSLSDVRGPYSLLVYGTLNPDLCVVGNGYSSLHEAGQAAIGMSTTVANGNAGSNGNTVVHQATTSENFTTNPSSTPPGPDAAVVDVSNTTVDNGQYFWVIEGQVGSQVTGATVLLHDGSSVVATVSNGLFAAWWPGQDGVSSIQVTTATGVN
jgi:hypothetical protein